MNILKFGGSSLSSPDHIKRVAKIVQKQLESGPALIVFSAFEGVTNDLLRMGDLATKRDLSYKELLQRNEDRHLQAVKILLPIPQQSQILSKLKNEFNELETLYEGVSLLGELSNRTLHVISSYGEIFSSIIIH